ncbi:hypothetical protein MMC07_009403 [Pseudocyphellaria aurata]|nr:hypothetical protein [Pseudocyphellaria aurata]
MGAPCSSSVRCLVQDEKEYHHQSRDIERGVEAEGTDGMEWAEKTRGSDGEPGGLEEARGDGPTYANLAMDSGQTSAEYVNGTGPSPGE